MPWVVALTGGISSGKSTVARAFASLGIDVIDADIIAREVVLPGEPALLMISEHFGPGCLQADGTLNRAWLREKIFANPAEKQWLNQVMHPLIQVRTQHQIKAARSAWCLWVVPLLVENQLAYYADRVLVVDVDEVTQIARTMARDGCSEAHVKRILAAQASREQRLAIADDVIVNDGTADALMSAVSRLNEKYLIMATTRQD